MEIQTIAYRVTTPLASTNSQLKYAPISGKLYRVTFSFPAGCNLLVEAFVRRGTVTIFPYPPDGIRLDDATKDYPLTETIEKHDPLEIYVVNHDGGFAHTITATLEIEGE